jgi:hypothetical protein
MRSPVGTRCPLCRIHRSLQQEVDVKELSLEEVLRIAGGLPLPAALDEVTYRTPEEAVNDPVDYAHLLGAPLRVAEPN